MPAKRVTALSKALAEMRELSGIGACGEALAASKRAFAKARRAKRDDAVAESVVEMAWNCARLGLCEEGLECALAARRLWARLGNGNEEARARAVEAFLLIDMGMSDDAFAMASEALTLAERGGDESVRAFAASIKALTLTLGREPQLGAALMEEAVELARNAGNEPLLTFVLVNLGFCQIKLADEAEQQGDAALARHWLDQAMETTDEAIGIGERCGEGWSRRVGLVNGAEFRARAGEQDAALGYLARAGAAPGDPGASLHIHYLYTLGNISLRAGDLDAAQQACSTALDMAVANGQVDHQLNALGKLGEVHEALGNFETALELQKRFHQVYVMQSGEAVQRRARVAEIRFESQKWQARAGELADQAMIDPLTGISNRRAFDLVLDRVETGAFAIAIADLDMFKVINDRFSHLVGDAVLKRVAALMVLHAGAAAEVARLGGEEFALVFPDLEIEAAMAHCEAIRQAVCDEDWSDLGVGLAVTVSIGVAAGENGRHGLLAAADKRLYAAKAAGRDVVIGSDEPARELRLVGV